jgi:hypothetical protein
MTTEDKLVQLQTYRHCRNCEVILEEHLISSSEQ